MNRLITLMVLFSFTLPAFAQTPTNGSQATAPAVAAPAAQPQAAPAVQPASVATNPAPAMVTVPTDVVVKAPSLVPPAWLQDLVISAESFPTIGPIVVKIIQYLALIVAIMTALCGCVIAICKALGGLAAFANLAGIATKVQAFQDGPIVYWLKYVSAFNAQKPDPAQPTQSA